MTSHEMNFAKATMHYMEMHQIVPTPENYMVWYHYVQGKNAALKEEIERMIAQQLPFTPGICATLHHRFFVADNSQKTVDAAALNTQRMLQDVMKAVNEFSGETASYNDDLGTYIQNISKDYGNEEINGVIKDLVGSTLALKSKGEQMNKHLEESKAEIEKLRVNLQQVTVEAQKDGLTGLFNRRTFERMMEEQIHAANHDNSELCIVMLDVDHFKKFNDTYGHLLGDEVLKIVAHTLTDSVKGRDVVARFGGEEFIVLLPHTPLEGAMKVADAIRQSIARKELKRKDTGQNFGQITVSLGVSRYRHGVDDNAKLVKRADEALYESKRFGRNRVTREA